LNKYRDLIQTFFVTDVMPPTIAYIKDMFRDVIVLSDTDSTCGSYDQWVSWYAGSIVFTPETTAVSAAIMTVNTQVIDHYLKVFTANMNVDKQDVELIKMKNEFYWLTLTTCNSSKHYYGDIAIQEGNVFAETELELKGVHLIASNVNEKIRKQAHEMILRIQRETVEGKGLNLTDYIKEVAAVERTILSDIKEGKFSVFKLDKIKEEKAYKLDKSRSPYLHKILWDDVFSDKYGAPGEPPYMVVNVPTLLKSRRSTSEFIDSVGDRDTAGKLSKFLGDRNKDNLGTFRIPLTIAYEKGIPEEIFGAIDTERVVTNNCNVFYMVLETIGFYRKPGMLICEMGY